MKPLITLLAIVGALTIIYGIVGTIIDMNSFDQTKGGYVYPYEGWTGTPINWKSMDVNDRGLIKRGYVIDIFVNGTTGMISFSTLGITYKWQTFSERALKVHQPREAFKKKGFNPTF